MPSSTPSMDITAGLRMRASKVTNLVDDLGDRQVPWRPFPQTCSQQGNVGKPISGKT